MVGMPPTWIERRLSGKTALDADDLELIAGVLGMTPLDLVAGATSHGDEAVVRPMLRRPRGGGTGAPAGVIRPSAANAEKRC